MNTERKIFDRGASPINRSGWTKPQGLARGYSALEDDLEGDIVIVGAGLAGASLALHLADAGVKPIVLEARQPGWGASGRNAGHILPIVRSIKVFKSFPDAGRAFLEVFRAHHTIPYDLATQYDIDCDATRCGYINGMSSKGAFEFFSRSRPISKGKACRSSSGWMQPKCAQRWERRNTPSAWPTRMADASIPTFSPMA